MKKLVYIFITGILLLGIFSCSVKPSYTDENIVTGLKEMLLKEFDIDALVKINGTTLGIAFKVPKLFSSNRKSMPIALDQLQNIMLCLRRVLLSTNANIDFFQINIRGEDSNLEISLIRYVKDLKILLLSGISFGDYSKRMLYRKFTNMESTGLKKIETFFDEIGHQKPEKLIASYLTADIKASSISPAFITLLWESIMKRNINFAIQEQRMVATDENTFCFYVKVKEFFEPKQGFENFTFSSYPGKTQEFVLELVSKNYFNALVHKILILDETTGNSPEMQSLIDEYGDPRTWPTSDFYVSTLSITDFIAEQIADRIQNRIIETMSEKEALFPRLTAVKGMFEEGVLKIFFIYRDNQIEVDPNDADLAIETAKNVCDSYKFDNCKEVKIGTLTGPLVSYPFNA